MLAWTDPYKIPPECERQYMAWFVMILPTRDRFRLIIKKFVKEYIDNPAMFWSSWELFRSSKNATMETWRHGFGILFLELDCQEKNLKNVM